MAKRVVINDLILKFSTNLRDVQRAFKLLKNLDKTQAKQQSKYIKGEQKKLDLAKKRLENAKAYIAGSKTLHKLREKSGKRAIYVEKQLKKAYLKNNKVQIAHWKKQASVSLDEHKAYDKRQKQKQNDQIAEARRDRKNARAREVAERRLAAMQRQRRKFAAKTLSSAPSMPIGAMGGAAVGAGAAGAAGGGAVIGFRRAEMSLRAAMNVSGQGGDFKEYLDLLQRNADFMNIKRAEHIQAFAGSRAAVSADILSNKDIMLGLQGMSAAAAMTGATPVKLAFARIGLEQILTSGLAMQEIYQVVENMTGAAPALYQAVGEMTGKEGLQLGDIKDMASKGKLTKLSGADFYKIFTRILNETYLEEFEKAMNATPMLFDRIIQRMDTALTLFGEGFNTQMKTLFDDISTFIENNGDTIREWGGTFGDIMQALWELAKKIGVALEPYIEKLGNFVDGLTQEDVNKAIDGLIALFAVLASAKVAGAILNLANLIDKIARVFGVASKVGTASTTAGLLANRVFPTGGSLAAGAGAGAGLVTSDILKHAKAERGDLNVFDLVPEIIYSTFNAIREQMGAGNGAFRDVFTNSSSPTEVKDRSINIENLYVEKTTDIDSQLTVP